MSEFQVEVVRVCNVQRHPNADSLMTAEANGYPVIFKEGAYQEGSLAVHVPIDSIVPADDPRWEFLGGHRRIKAKRLRGIFSMGLLADADPAWEVGQNVQAELRIEKYDPDLASESPHEDDDVDPGLCPVYDIEGLRKFKGLFEPGEQVWISEKIHGQCVSRATRVTMADGSRRFISDVAVGDAVLGVRDGACVPSLVTHLFRKPAPGQWWRVQGERKGVGRGNPFFRVQCTAEHRFWSVTKGNFVAASDLSPGEKVLVVRGDAGLSPLQEQVLTGKMLGDGSLYETRWAAHVQWGHARSDAAYMDWIGRALGADLAGEGRTARVSGYGSKMISGGSRSSAWIKEMFSDWFSANNVKKIPPRLAQELTPIALAFWYMDDGSLTHSDGQEDRASFATCAFDDDDHSVLIDALGRLGVRATMREHGGHPRLYIDADQAERLFLLVATYIPPCMQRKLPARYRGGPGWLPLPGPRQYKPMLVEQIVTHVEPDDAAQPSSCFDLETETHNYFANGVLVHNSSRFVHDGERLHVGSRGKFKKLGAPVTWNAVAARYRIAEKLAAHPGIALYGETYGNNTDMSYGVRRPEGDRLVIFDVLDTKTRRWFSPAEMLSFVAALDLPVVPTLYEGPWSPELVELSEGKTTMPGADHVREGIVVKPLVERFDWRVGRVFLKLAGQGYLLRKGA